MDEQLSNSEIQGYNEKHKRIRGSLELKYPPKESCCRKGCGYQHYKVEIRGKTETRQHPCFLAIGHEGPCEFSSECASMLTERAAA